MLIQHSCTPAGAPDPIALRASPPPCLAWGWATNLINQTITQQPNNQPSNQTNPNPSQPDTKTLPPSRQMDTKCLKIEYKLDRKSINLGPKNHQVGSQKSLPGASWRGLWAILAPRQPQEPKGGAKARFWLTLGPPSWSQKGAQIVTESIKKEF